MENFPPNVDLLYLRVKLYKMVYKLLYFHRISLNEKKHSNGARPGLQKASKLIRVGNNRNEIKMIV